MSVATGTPPRRRGERLCGGHRGPQRRNTPASAGRTPCRPGASGPGTEHPRVGGENRSEVSTTSEPGGTPPRRRGEHGERCVRSGFAVPLLMLWSGYGGVRGACRYFIWLCGRYLVSVVCVWICAMGWTSRSGRSRGFWLWDGLRIRWSAIFLIRLRWRCICGMCTPLVGTPRWMMNRCRIGPRARREDRLGPHAAGPDSRTDVRSGGRFMPRSDGRPHRGFQYATLETGGRRRGPPLLDRRPVAGAH